MSLLNTLRDSLFGRRSSNGATREAEPDRVYRSSELPAFTLELAEAMRFDAQVRIGLGARNGLLMPARAEAISNHASVARFVQSQWDQIWRGTGQLLLRAKLFGFLPLEIAYRAQGGGEFAGAMVIDTVRDYHPRRTRVLVRNGEIAGFRLDPETKRARDLLAPLGLVCTFDSEFGNPYGCSLLERAFAPWYEKWMHGGAKKLLRLRMLKDAYIGEK